MSRELSEALRLCMILRGRPARNAYDWEAADTIEQLIRERDEARALLEIADLAQMEAKEAEARGYRRGVQAAEAAAWKWAPVCRCRHEIRALLEKEKAD